MEYNQPFEFQKRKFGLSTELINQIFLFHSPTDAAPQFRQKVTPFTHLNFKFWTDTSYQLLSLL